MSFGLSLKPSNLPEKDGPTQLLHVAEVNSTNSNLRKLVSDDTEGGGWILC